MAGLSSMKRNPLAGYVSRRSALGREHPVAIRPSTTAVAHHEFSILAIVCLCMASYCRLLPSITSPPARVTSAAKTSRSRPTARKWTEPSTSRALAPLVWKA